MAHRWMQLSLSVAAALQLGCGSIECPAGLVRDEQQCICPPGTTLLPESGGQRCVDAGTGDADAGDPGGWLPPVTVSDDGGTVERDGGTIDHDGGTPTPPPMPPCTDSSPERCDSRDNDCDGRADEGLGDVCGACRPVDEVCDGKDNDCDQLVDEGLLNRCGTCGELPAEFCDERDNDCDGRVDEEVEAAPRWYPDCDLDGYAPVSPGIKSCRRPSPSNECDWTQVAPETFSIDCDDSLREFHPAAGFGYHPRARQLPGRDPILQDPNCDGVAEPSASMVALWPGNAIARFLSPLPLCVSGSCPCLQESISFEPPLTCGYGYVGLVREQNDSGRCEAPKEAMVFTLCR